MKRFAICALVFVVLIGCQPVQTGNREISEEYRKGTQGLVMSFVQGNPPQQLFKSSPFIVMVQLWNRGAEDIEGGKIYLTGYDKKYVFGEHQKEMSFSIEGKSPFNPEGDMTELVEFKDPSIEAIPDDIDTFAQSIKVSACYYYRTVASPEICINPRQYSADASESVCQVKDVSLSGGQGAPIAVTKVEQELMDNKIFLKIYIQNSGGGTPFEVNKGITDCHKNLQITDIDKINIEEVGFSNFQLTSGCKPNPIRLVNNQGFFICSAELDNLGDTAFVTPLEIRVGYNYRQTLTKTVKIVNI
ncbi:hypothetical protein JW930_04715 [Candidatus Woesearchaeota archaeon]|nr:hypothetical protein [Candidatus Woesearchaeota archaeon]